MIYLNSFLNDNKPDTSTNHNMNGPNSHEKSKSSNSNNNSASMKHSSQQSSHSNKSSSSTSSSSKHHHNQFSSNSNGTGLDSLYSPNNGGSNNYPGKSSNSTTTTTTNSPFSLTSASIRLKLNGKFSKLSASELLSVKNLINSYRESAAFLTRSAEELEQIVNEYMDASS